MADVGKVYLVGAGPGDPELITLKGRRVLSSAGCVLYDHLANTALLDFAPAAAERIYVGKKHSDHAATQAEIGELLVAQARAGKTVVRLKGGDPFIFGRGGEELEVLAEAGIAFEVVPGVTTPLGIAAYSGVPLTHRDHASALTFISGHDPERVDWSLPGTIVVFMGLNNAAAIARAMMAGGRSAETPVMVTRWATRPDQHSVRGTLADIGERIEREALKPPATMIVGDVVRFADRFNWFERLPLFGQRVVVTRDRNQAGDLTARLRAAGAEAIELPVIEIAPAADPAPMEAAIARLDEYDWLIFTSANGVRAFLDHLDRSPRDLRALRAKLCAIGPATRHALELLHLKVDLTPAEYVAESLLESFAKFDIQGQRVLLPRAAVARDVIPLELRRRGAHVDVVEAYRTVMPAGARTRAAAVVARKPHWVAFTSSSTVNNFIEAAGREALNSINAVSIGPITSATLREHGVEPAAEAKPYTIDGILRALCAAR